MSLIDRLFGRSQLADEIVKSYALKRIVVIEGIQNCSIIRYSIVENIFNDSYIKIDFKNKQLSLSNNLEKIIDKGIISIIDLKIENDIIINLRQGNRIHFKLIVTRSTIIIEDIFTKFKFKNSTSWIITTRMN
jgi:hypothetical protein